MFIALIILFLASLSGIILYSFKKVNPSLLASLIALGAGSMLSISLVHILTESLESNEFAIYAFMGGFLLIYIIEEFLTPHHHDHSHGDHSHEDPHEHYDHVALVSFVAIFLHTIFDGLGIRAGFSLSETLGYSVLLSVAIHQIPVSLSLSALFRESKFRTSTQIFFIIAFACAAPLGFFLSNELLTLLRDDISALATAFAGGSLLYVATADLLPMIHGKTKKKYIMMTFFLLGAVCMTAVKWFE